VRTVSNSWRRARAGLAAGAIISGVSVGAQAMTFAQAWDAARAHDAQFQVAGHKLASSQFAVPIARSALLPQVSLSAAASESTGTREFPNALNQQVRTRLEYAAPQSSLTLRLPIFNAEALGRLHQAQAQSDVAQTVYRVRAFELLDRLAFAYTQVLLAQEGRRLAEAQWQAQVTQLTQLQQRLLRGEGTRVETAQAQAIADVLRVRVTEADDQLELTRRQLRRITGLPTPALPSLASDAKPAAPAAETLFEWLQMAVNQNPILQARDLALVAARLAVKRNFAAHYPKLDLVASASRSQNESTSNLNQTTNLRTLSVQLSVPIFSGGGIDASVKQALADQARVEQEIRVERENIEVEVQRYYLAMVTGRSRWQALQGAVDAAELALRGATRALQEGLGTANDVSEVQTRLFAARREVAQAQLDYWLGRTRLMIQAGLSTSDVVADLDRALHLQPLAPSPTARP
jgi:outer membrane protein, protease secretion system